MSCESCVHGYPCDDGCLCDCHPIRPLATEWKYDDECNVCGQIRGEHDDMQCLRVQRKGGLAG